MPAAAKAIGQARDQRRLRPDHHEVDLLALGERHLARDVLGADVDAFGHLGDAGIAGRAEQLCAQGGGRNRPAERMFAAAAAHHQDSHGEALTMVCALRHKPARVAVSDGKLRRPSDAGVTTSNVPEFTVSELSVALKRELETAFPRVRVRGEISQPAFPRSGHCYFRLKDENAVIDGVCWKGTVPAARHQDRGRAWRSSPPASITTYAGSLALPDHHRPPGAGRRRRAAEAARGPAQEARGRGAVRRRAQAAAAVPARGDRRGDLADRRGDPRHPAPPRRPLPAPRAGLAGGGAGREGGGARSPRRSPASTACRWTARCRGPTC